jgi:uncharacterized protein (DUF983 family)
MHEGLLVVSYVCNVCGTFFGRRHDDDVTPMLRILPKVVPPLVCILTPSTKKPPPSPKTKI